MKTTQGNKDLKTLMVLMGLVMIATVQAQIKIGHDAAPAKGAVLELNSVAGTDNYIGGLRLPNVSITNLNAIPAEFTESSGIATDSDKEALIGMVVYNTNTTTGVGVYSWNGTQWLKQSDATTSLSAGIPEAPQDGNVYIRKNSNWENLFERGQSIGFVENIVKTGLFSTSELDPTNCPLYYVNTSNLKNIHLYKFGYTAGSTLRPLTVVYQNTDDITTYQGSLANVGAKAKVHDGLLFTITPTNTNFNTYLLDGSDPRVVIHNDKLDSQTGLLYIDANTTMGFGIYDSSSTSPAYFCVASGDSENAYYYPSGTGLNQASATRLQFTIIAADQQTMDAGYEDSDLKQIEQRLAALKNQIAKDSYSTQFSGKKISFLGDSYTAFTSYVPAGNANFYPTAFMSTVEQTYWWKLIKDLGLELVMNESWSGSGVVAKNGTDANSPVISTGRATKLHNGSIEPDIILINVGMNDFYQKVPLGTYNGVNAPPLINATPTTFREAYAVMLLQIHTRYPKAEVYCCTLMGGKGNALGFPEKNDSGVYLTEYNQAIREVATAFGSRVLELAASGMNISNTSIYTGDGLHPNELGMDLMFYQIRGQMLSRATTAISPNR